LGTTTFKQLNHIEIEETRSIMRGHRPQFLVKSCRALLQENKSQSLVRRYGTVGATPLTPQSSAFQNAVEATAPRNNWTKEEIKEIYETPLMKLAFAAVSFILMGCGG
jgi:biotin synthase